MSKNITLRFIVRGALIAALYCAITLLLAPISFGQMQLRVSEALTLLPILTPAAIPGLFVGCLISNVFGGNGLVDIIFGSLATLCAAILTRKFRKNIFIGALPPVVINAVVIGFVLNYVLELPLLPSMGWVGLGQIGACYIIGIPLIYALRKLPGDIFED